MPFESLLRSWMLLIHEQKPNLVCTCFSMMSFVFAPAANNKPNLQPASMTLSMTPNHFPPPPPKKKKKNFGLYIYICLVMFFFWLGLSMRLNKTNGYTGFFQGNKNGTRRKSIFPFQLHINVQRRKVIGPQNTAACDLFYVSIGMNDGKFTYGNIRHTH